VRGKTIAILGLTFKPNTDDLRDAPALAIIQTLQDAGAKVRAYDPEGMAHAKKILENVEFAEDVYACVTGADATAIITEWNEFRALDLERVRGLMNHPVLVDLRNIYRREEVERYGFDYVAIGRQGSAKRRRAADRAPQAPKAASTSPSMALSDAS